MCSYRWVNVAAIPAVFDPALVEAQGGRPLYLEPGVRLGVLVAGPDGMIVCRDQEQLGRVIGYVEAGPATDPFEVARR